MKTFFDLDRREPLTRIHRLDKSPDTSSSGRSLIPDPRVSRWDSRRGAPSQEIRRREESGFSRCCCGSLRRWPRPPALIGCADPTAWETAASNSIGRPTSVYGSFCFPLVASPRSRLIGSSAMSAASGSGMVSSVGDDGELFMRPAFRPAASRWRCARCAFRDGQCRLGDRSGARNRGSLDSWPDRHRRRDRRRR